jgi:hypothetical protein
MTKPMRMTTTLSPKSASGSTAYNAYYYFTQLSGLYAVALETETKPDHKKKWLKLSDSALEDVGALYKVWEWVLLQIRNGAMKPEVNSQWEMVARACLRMAVIHNATHLWTPMTVWVRLGLRCEYRWGKILQGFALQDPALWNGLSEIYSGSQKRRALLGELEGLYGSAATAIDEWFAADDPTLSDSVATEATLVKTSPNVTPTGKLKIIGNP